MPATSVERGGAKRNGSVHEPDLRGGADRLLEQDSASSISAERDDVRRQQADDRVRRAVDEQPTLERRVDDRRGRPIELEAPHQPGAADLANGRVPRRDRAQPRLEVRADPRDVRHRDRGRSAPRGTPARRGTPAGCRRRCCRDRRARRPRRRGRVNIAAPIGTPAPSALPSAIRSGVSPSTLE